jgi:hypothetical protein
MLVGFALFDHDFAYVGLVAAVDIPAPHWQPNFSSQARSRWFSQTQPMPKPIEQFLSMSARGSASMTADYTARPFSR